MIRNHVILTDFIKCGAPNGPKNVPPYPTNGTFTAVRSKSSQNAESLNNKILSIHDFTGGEHTVDFNNSLCETVKLLVEYIVHTKNSKKETE